MHKRFQALWAIRPEAAMTVLGLMASENRAGAAIGASAAQPEMTGVRRWAAAAPYTARTAGNSTGSGSNKVAIIPIQGVLTQDGPSYYGTNYQTIADAAEKAAADPDVKRIVLAVDSPGGEVTGLPETASVLAAAAKVKPVSAIVEGAAASAAYWLTSQASDITVTPSGEVGSVGVRMMHADMSGALAKAGINVTELHAGDFKTEWSPYATLTGPAKAAMQAKLDAPHEDFVAAITRGRGQRASVDMRRSRYGQGRMFSSADALRGGLVDNIGSARDFLRTLGGGVSLYARASPVSSTHRARVALERLRAL